MKGFCTTAEAATALGISGERIRQLAAGGRIKGAEKIGKVWLIPVDREGRPKVELGSPGRPTNETRKRLERNARRRSRAQRWPDGPK